MYHKQRFITSGNALCKLNDIFVFTFIVCLWDFETLFKVLFFALVFPCVGKTHNVSILRNVTNALESVTFLSKETQHFWWCIHISIMLPFKESTPFGSKQSCFDMVGICSKVMQPSKELEPFFNNDQPL